MGFTIQLPFGANNEDDGFGKCHERNRTLKLTKSAQEHKMTVEFPMESDYFIREIEQSARNTPREHQNIVSTGFPLESMTHMRLQSQSFKMRRCKLISHNEAIVRYKLNRHPRTTKFLSQRHAKEKLSIKSFHHCSFNQQWQISPVLGTTKQQC
ncbi:hypothetical protein V8C40DRAFT_257532 [Trichoderma camerunense]